MKLIKKILNLIKIKIIKKLYLTKKIDKKKKFTLIYKTNYWSDNDSVSGSGSGKKNTENIIKELSQIIKTYNMDLVIYVKWNQWHIMELEKMKKTLNFMFLILQKINFLVQIYLFAGIVLFIFLMKI